MRKGLIIQLIVLGVVVGAVAVVVSFWIPWLPDLASEEGGRIDDVYVLTSIICLAIFAIVAAVSIYAVVKFRAKGDDDDEDGKPIHGHTGLEVFWTAIPVALVTVIAIYSGIVLVQNEDLPDDHRVIEVTAAQFAWSFTYPDIGVTTGVLRVPVDETIEFRMESLDVIHSFWVPEWRQKQDVVPGTVQRVIVTPTETGTFPLVCTELCGLGHSTMRAQVVVMPEQEFAAWAQEQQASGDGGEGGEAADGQQVFVDAGCGGCHTLADAGTDGDVGPNLDNVVSDVSAEQIRQAIVEPDAEIAPGFEGGIMPQDYAESLTTGELDALVEYLSTAGSS